MDDKNPFLPGEKEEEEVVKDNKPILGQMCYDEIITRNENFTIETNKNIILTGQMQFTDIVQKERKKEEPTNETNQKQNMNNTYEKVENTTKKTEKKLKKEKEKQPEKDDKDGIICQSLEEVIHNSMIPYTEHVVMDRALPRVEDGLKPGQRRILYSMLELGLSPDKQYRKSARIVGDCMGKYHPHGDSSVYDAMVRMAQNFSLRAPLVDGHGNFGSVDGDSAAAMRYTEAKLTPLAMELLRDLDKNTVRWSLNFDDTLKEPDMLPGRFPNLLVNGTSGIAVGVATNIPPHNLGECINGVIAYIDNNDITLDEMMKYIPCPDFPTGGIIIAGDELRQAYETGKGKITLRAKTHFEDSDDKTSIVITEIPYQVNKAALLQKIVEIKDANKEKLSAITEIRDESDRRGLRAVIKVKKEANAKVILDFLLKSTNLQITVPLNMVAIAGGKPKQMSLIEIISYYVEYQRQVVYRRTKFELDEALDRAHIIQGLLVAIKNIDEVVRIIKKSSSVADAKANLMKRFNLSEKQAQAILDMRLARLVNLEIEKLETELKELEIKIKKLTAIYNSKAMQFKVVKTEMLEIKKTYENPRMSNMIHESQVEMSKVEEIEETFARDVILAVTANGGLKKLPIKNYNLSQKSITDSSTLNEVHTQLYPVKTNEKVFVFTNLGNVLKLSVDKVPDLKWKDNSCALNTIEKNAQPNEKAICILPIEQENSKLVFFTKFGYVKLSSIEEYTLSKTYYQAIKLKEEDEVISVEFYDTEGTILMVSQNAMALRFAKTDIPEQNRISSGVRGINIEDDDKIIFAGQTGKIGAITVVTDKGFAKKVPIGEYELLPRYRKGLRIIPLKDNGTKLIFANFTADPTPIVLKEKDKLIFIDNKKISYDSRAAKGKQIHKRPLTEGYIYKE